MKRSHLRHFMSRAGVASTARILTHQTSNMVVEDLPACRCIGHQPVESPRVGFVRKHLDLSLVVIGRSVWPAILYPPYLRQLVLVRTLSEFSAISYTPLHMRY
jgi:hypothetical protein